MQPTPIGVDNGDEVPRMFWVNVDAIEQRTELDICRETEDGLAEKPESETAKEMW